MAASRYWRRSSKPAGWRRIALAELAQIGCR